MLQAEAGDLGIYAAEDQESSVNEVSRYAKRNARPRQQEMTKISLPQIIFARMIRLSNSPLWLIIYRLYHLPRIFNWKHSVISTRVGCH